MRLLLTRLYCAPSESLTLLREMRQQKPELKMIFVSGYAEEAFQKSLPWLAGQLGTPGIPKSGFPAGSAAPAAPSGAATSVAAGPLPGK